MARPVFPIGATVTVTELINTTAQITGGQYFLQQNTLDEPSYTTSVGRIEWPAATVAEGSVSYLVTVGSVSGGYTSSQSMNWPGFTETGFITVKVTAFSTDLLSASISTTIEVKPYTPPEPINSYAVRDLSIEPFLRVKIEGNYYPLSSGGADPSTITDLTGTKWLMNETLNEPSAFTTYQVNHKIGSETGSRLDFVNTGTEPIIKCIQNERIFPQFYYFVNQGETVNEWTDESYRTWEFTGGSDATNQTLINYIRANGMLVATTEANPIVMFGYKLWDVDGTRPDSYTSLMDDPDFHVYPNQGYYIFENTHWLDGLVSPDTAYNLEIAIEDAVGRAHDPEQLPYFYACKFTTVITKAKPIMWIATPEGVTEKMIGIKTTDPEYDFDVNGNIGMNGRRVLGYVAELSSENLDNFLDTGFYVNYHRNYITESRSYPADIAGTASIYLEVIGEAKKETPQESKVYGCLQRLTAFAWQSGAGYILRGVYVRMHCYDPDGGGTSPDWSDWVKINYI